MSDPVTNVEIEDVLSSIRRLVSEGDKAKRAEKEAAQTQEKAPEKLVLTPALRVSKTPDDSDVDDNTPEPLQEYAAAQDAAVIEDTPMAFVSPSAVPDAEPTPMADDPADDTVSFDRAKLEQSDIRFDRANLEATIAELEAAVTEQPDDWEPDGSDTNLDPSWAAAGFPSDQPVEDAIEVADSETPEAYVLKEAVAEVVESHAMEAPAMEEAPALSDPRGDDDTTLMPPLSFRHVTPDVGAEADDEDHADDLRETNDAPEADDLAAYLSDTTEIDEDALRQLVLEIVRAELQGKLGERITRNVRKLVRREIHRVLTSQDLD